MAHKSKNGETWPLVKSNRSLKPTSIRARFSTPNILTSFFPAWTVDRQRKQNPGATDSSAWRERAKSIFTAEHLMETMNKWICDSRSPLTSRSFWLRHHSPAFHPSAFVPLPLGQDSAILLPLWHEIVFRWLGTSKLQKPYTSYIHVFSPTSSDHPFPPHFNSYFCKLVFKKKMWLWKYIHTFLP